MTIRFLSEDGMTRTYALKDGREVIITINDFDISVAVKTPKGESVGRVEFKEIESIYPNGDRQFKLTWMYLEGLGGSYMRHGIGRECLLFFKDVMGGEIFASPNDGQRQDDGSHLTQDAPGFVARMQKEGIILGGGRDIDSSDPEDS